MQTMLEIVMPKNYVNLLAGLVSLVFERLGLGRESAAALPELAFSPEPIKPAAPPKPTAVAKLEPQSKADDLTVINGIGPTFARRLNEAGIKTFAQLATTQPEELKIITKVASWQAVDPASWITTAKQLA
jgi:predicted flap endonuclease-1-like 5' DNA nuclease